MRLLEVRDATSAGSRLDGFGRLPPRCGGDPGAWVLIATRALAYDPLDRPGAVGQQGAQGNAPVAPLSGGVAESLYVYLRSALTLRDIHSLKLTRARAWAEGLRFGLITLSVTATCLSFTSAAKVAGEIGVSKGTVDFVINVLLLIVIVADPRGAKATGPTSTSAIRLCTSSRRKPDRGLARRKSSSLPAFIGSRPGGGLGPRVRPERGRRCWSSNRRSYSATGR